MRQFVIEEQEKEWLFDLDGNVYHPKLRDAIEKGMVVGLRITERDIPSNERIDFIDKFKNYYKLHQEYSDFHKEENQRKEDLKKEVRKIIVEYEEQRENLIQEKALVEKKISEFKKQTKDEEKSKPQFKKVILSFGKELGEIEKKIFTNKKHLDRLKDAVIHNPIYYKEDLIREFNFDEVLFEDRFDSEKFDDLEQLFFETATKERPWSETIFFKVVKRDGDKLYADVFGRFRRMNSKCPLKEGDRISFYAKSIFLVPSILNKKSKLKSYLQTNFKYKYYRAKVVTNWHGVFLDEKVRELIGPGSTVRFQLKEVNGYGHIRYAYILEEEDGFFWGELLGVYIVEEEKITYPIKTGCIFKFSRESITEIPTKWWNDHLPELEKHKNRDNIGYAITGYRSEDNYFDLEDLK